MAPRQSIPSGWSKIERLNPKNGKLEKFYTNALGQKFYSMEDLLRYVSFAKQEKLSIYSEGFSAPTTGESSLLNTKNANRRPRGKRTSLIVDDSGERAPEKIQPGELINIDAPSGPRRSARLCLNLRASQI